MGKKTVLVLFGGRSSEHEVSLVSARSIIGNIPREHYDVLTVGITKDGKWILTSASTDEIASGTWESSPENCSAILSPVYKEGLLIYENNQVKKRHIDVVFPALHGENGEDGTIQGLFTLSGIPFVGSGVRSSADCMDKITAKHLLRQAGIPVTESMTLLYHQYKAAPVNMAKDIEKRFGYPVFIKPSGTGSSVGISKAKNRKELSDALKNAFRYDSRVLAEEAVLASEIEVAVIGTISDTTASSCGEIVPANEFYDYESKYVSESNLYIPARISDEKAEIIRRYACLAFQVLDCYGMARVDFFINDNRILLNEVNTLPGFTSISMYPKLFSYDGLDYPSLLNRLILLAMDR